MDADPVLGPYAQQCVVQHVVKLVEAGSGAGHRAASSSGCIAGFARHHVLQVSSGEGSCGSGKWHCWAVSA